MEALCLRHPVVACQCKIYWIIATVMLLGYDVFDMKRRLVVCLAKEAILAPISRSLSNKRASSRVH